MRLAGSRLPWVWTGFVGVAALSAVLFVDGGQWESTQTAWETAVVVALPVFLSFLGALIATRQPGNRVSWLLFVSGAGLLGVTVLSEMYGPTVGPPADAGFWDYFLIWVHNSTGSAFVIYPLFLLLFIFPTGTFLSRRWSWALWLPGLLVLLIAVLGAFSETVGPLFADQGEIRWAIDNPIGFLPISLLDAVVQVWSLFLVVILPVGGVVSLIVRYRKSSLVVRTQIRWVIYASAIAAIAFPIGVWWLSGHPVWEDIFWLIALAVIPIAITVAITRYRLFEIDRIISRTLSYTVVVVLLGGLFLGLVTLVTSLLPAQSSLAVAGATLAVAALFNPLRRRIQHAVDRRFNRSSYQADLVSEHFAAKLSEPLSVQEIMGLWSQTVEEALQPQATGIWVRDHPQRTAP